MNLEQAKKAIRNATTEDEAKAALQAFNHNGGQIRTVEELAPAFREYCIRAKQFRSEAIHKKQFKACPLNCDTSQANPRKTPKHENTHL